VPPYPHRPAAIAALAGTAAVAILGVQIVVSQFPRGLLVPACLLIALLAAWHGLTRVGARRHLGLGVAFVAAAAAAAFLIVDGDHLLQALLVVLALGLALAGTRSAFRVREPLDPAPDPRRPVLFYNPKSGGGKAERFKLDEEARSRGIEPIELELGADLEQLVRGAVAEGADALVATVAAELDLPYACIPAGTRNHFALDLGVDRDDVVGALEAFVGGREKRVDLAEVNGRVFVNNVSIGLYAEAVQREGYREAKLRTILDTLPEALGPEGGGAELRWRGPDGPQHSSGAAVLVSNDRYRLGPAVGSGTRPRLDAGVLGIAVASPPGAGGPTRRPWQEWTSEEFEVDADGPVAAGIDGEAATIAAPLRFRTRPGALRVRIAAAHPGASPSAAMPEGAWATIKGLAWVAARGTPARQARLAR
jgi:hypothetical protein